MPFAAPSLKRPATEALLPSTAAFFGGEEALSPANEAKKARVVLTDEQKHILRSAYDEDSYPSSETVNTLARQLGLSVRTVVNWFHNRRMRSKPPPGTAPAGQGDEAEEAVSDDGIDASAFGGDVPDQYYSYEDELAFAHAELERLATEEDGVGMEQHSEDLGSSLNADDSGWGAGGAAMDNMGWTGDDEEPIEEDTGNPYHGMNDEGDGHLDASQNGSTSADNGEHEAGSVSAKPRISLLERLERYVKREDPSWEDENGRTEAIARLERSLNHEENTEWEF